MLRALIASPSLRAAAVFALGGAGFTLGNLILARFMSPGEYGLVSLIIGIVAVASPVAPLGLDLSIAKRGLLLGSTLRHSALAAATLTAFITALIASWIYQLRVALVICVFVSTIASGVTQTVSAHFQGQRRFSIAVPFLQVSNWALVPVAIIAAASGGGSAVLPAGLLASLVSVTALVGWLLVVRELNSADARTKASELWSEALSLMTIIAAGSVFLQLERLVVPIALGVESLATFGVLAALVGSPFRMIQAAVTFTLVPRLSEAATAQTRRDLLQREFVLVTMAMAAGSLMIWFIAPWIATWLLAERYHLHRALIAATLVSGVLKVFSAFGTATVTALAPERDLRQASLASWASIALGTIAAMLLAPWGLSAVIYGISLGWFARCLLTSWIALPYLRDHPELSTEQLRVEG